METWWKSAVSTQPRANHSTFYRNCAFPQNFHIRKLCEITVFYGERIVQSSVKLTEQKQEGDLPRKSQEKQETGSDHFHLSSRICIALPSLLYKSLWIWSFEIKNKVIA